MSTKNTMKKTLQTNLVGKRVKLADKAAVSVDKMMQFNATEAELPPLYKSHAALKRAGGGSICAVRVEGHSGDLCLTVETDAGELCDYFRVGDLVMLGPL